MDFSGEPAWWTRKERICTLADLKFQIISLSPIQKNFTKDWKIEIVIYYEMRDSKLK